MHTVRPLARLAGAVCLLALAVALFPPELAAQPIPDSVLTSPKFRAIGPTRQSGRFVDFAVPLQDTATIYAATGSGGLWKSVNNGHSWTPIFDNQPVISMTIGSISGVCLAFARSTERPLSDGLTSAWASTSS
jgi:hypothetical protein